MVAGETDGSVCSALSTVRLLNSERIRQNKKKDRAPIALRLPQRESRISVHNVIMLKWQVEYRMQDGVISLPSGETRLLMQVFFDLFYTTAACALVAVCAQTTGAQSLKCRASPLLENIHTFSPLTSRATMYFAHICSE